MFLGTFSLGCSDNEVGWILLNVSNGLDGFGFYTNLLFSIIFENIQGSDFIALDIFRGFHP